MALFVLAAEPYLFRGTLLDVMAYDCAEHLRCDPELLTLTHAHLLELRLLENPTIAREFAKIQECFGIG